jgi:hypothetical protein
MAFPEASESSCRFAPVIGPREKSWLNPSIESAGYSRLGSCGIAIPGIKPMFKEFQKVSRSALTGEVSRRTVQLNFCRELQTCAPLLGPNTESWKGKNIETGTCSLGEANSRSSFWGTILSTPQFSWHAVRDWHGFGRVSALLRSKGWKRTSHHRHTPSHLSTQAYVQ